MKGLIIMHDSLYTKRTENDQSKKASPHTQRPVQRSTAPSHLPLYIQALRNKPLPWLDISAMQQVSQEGEQSPQNNVPMQRKENTTGLPDQLKAGIENLSGLPLDDVQVHYNSAKPAQVQALAYTQGTEIHVGSGQEQHLAHEVWHVVQQKQGRVQPTFQLRGIAINDDSALEREADVMGEKARNFSHTSLLQTSPTITQKYAIVVQRVHENLVENGNGNVTGGSAAISWSLAGNSMKPLAIIEGTLQINGVNRDIEVHVHLNANNPVSTFSGTNVRFRGVPAGFAYWSANTVNSKQWLKQILDAGLPNWHEKSTWTAVDPQNRIAWQGAANPGWLFDEAQRANNRRSNTNYEVTFEVKYNKEQDDNLFGSRANAIKQLLGARISAVSVKKANKNTSKVTLTYIHEQEAYEHLDEDLYILQARWPSFANLNHTPPNAWV
jgi:hypothetical protein